VDLRRVVKFAGVSGAGLCLDYAVYALLCSAGLDAGVANLVSAACGVTFVFVVSARHIFESGGGFMLRLFAVYAVYQVIAIAIASGAVHEATALFGGQYLLGKTVVLPFSFTANYLFMSWLFAARGRLTTA
jgi:putative flippase GtrA